jgi:hypothetical protein
MSDEEVVEGYFDGRKSDLDDLPKGSNRSDGYKHGWRNGRDDRKGSPRSSADVLRQEASDIAAREHAAL